MGNINDDVVIKVDNVKKYFKVYPDKGKTLKDKVLFRKRNRYELREVLKGISFEVKRGEAIGLIGKNGCGKSTTLKMLTKILRPNEGSIEIKGRVSSLIELGAGFHPDLTGRENIYINASIFGIKAKEVDERLDDIIRFSELEDYIDNPVRTYSSGMYMRLAFAVAINVDADVLLIDEILAVGDVNFQEKCFRKLQEIKRNGTTIVIVSHAQGQIEKICERCIWIEEGLIQEEGDTKVICRAYQLAMEGKRVERARKEAEEELAKLKREAEEEAIRKQKEEQEEKKRLKREAQEEKKRLKKEEEEKRKQEELRRKEEELRRKEEELQKKQERARKLKNLSCREICKQSGPDARREGSGRVEFTEVQMNGGKGPLLFELGDEISVKMKCKGVDTENRVKISLGISRSDLVYCFGTSTQKYIDKFININGEKEIEFKFKNTLLQGRYFVDLIIEDEQGERYDVLYQIMEFGIENPNYKEVGIAQLEYHWSIG